MAIVIEIMHSSCSRLKTHEAHTPNPAVPVDPRKLAGWRHNDFGAAQRGGHFDG